MKTTRLAIMMNSKYPGMLYIFHSTQMDKYIANANKFYPVEKAFELLFSVEAGTIDNTSTVVAALKYNRIEPVNGRWYDAEHEEDIKKIMNGIL